VEEDGMTQEEALLQLIGAIKSAVYENAQVDDAICRARDAGAPVRFIAITIQLADVNQAITMQPAAATDTDFLRRLRIEPDIEPRFQQELFFPPEGGSA
jgi:hypothetical protein